MEKGDIYIYNGKPAVVVYPAIGDWDEVEIMTHKGLFSVSEDELVPVNPNNLEYGKLLSLIEVFQNLIKNENF